MSTWWRKCRYCGAPGDDPRICPMCGAFLPYESEHSSGDDVRIAAGCLFLVVTAVILLLILIALATLLAGR